MQFQQCFWFHDDDTDHKLHFCYYILPISQCWFIHISVKFWCYIKKKKFEKMDWTFLLGVGANTTIKHIDQFEFPYNLLSFIPFKIWFGNKISRTLEQWNWLTFEFMSANLSRIFILIVVNGLGPNRWKHINRNHKVCGHY